MNMDRQAAMEGGQVSGKACMPEPPARVPISALQHLTQRIRGKSPGLYVPVSLSAKPPHTMCLMGEGEE